MKRKTPAAAVLAGLITLTGCGGGAGHTAQHAAADPRNMRVCEHYRTQRAFVLNDAEPSLADAAKVLGWVAADQAQAVPGSPLARDLDKMLTAMQGSHGSTYTASRQ